MIAMSFHPRTSILFAAALCGAICLPPARTQTIAGLTQYTIGNPNGDEAEILQIINRSRSNPAAEGQRLVDSLAELRFNASIIDVDLLLAQFQTYDVRPPLAFNAHLNASARAHVADMVATGLLQHDSSDGTPADVRMKSFGYAMPGGESVVGGYVSAVTPWLTEGVYQIDYGVPSLGHRLNVFQPGILGSVEIGIAQQAFGGWNTTDFGANSTPTLLTGAVFMDKAGTGFYASGEGVGSVTVTAPGASSYYAVTVDSGAYTLPLDLLAFDPTATNPAVRVVFTDALGNVTTQAVALQHTVVPSEGVTDYTDAEGRVRYDNVQANLIASSVAVPTPTPAGALPNVTVEAVDGGAGFVLTRTGDASGVLAVNYAVKGTAVAGQDYVPFSGHKKFKPGKSQVRIKVMAIQGAVGKLKIKLLPVTDGSYTPALPGQAKLHLGGQ